MWPHRRHVPILLGARGLSKASVCHDAACQGTKHEREEAMTNTMARVCIKCGRTAESPMLPLCMECDLTRLRNGETADDIKREAAALREREPK